jgi:hypothetical protein
MMTGLVPSYQQHFFSGYITGDVVGESVESQYPLTVHPKFAFSEPGAKLIPELHYALSGHLLQTKTIARWLSERKMDTLSPGL